MTNSRRSSSEESTGFDRLAEPVRRWIWRRGWRGLRDIQEAAIAALLDDDRDLIVAAPTAGGKTEAAFLPLISSVVERPGEGGFDLVYVGPLRALINDQFRRLEELCEMSRLPVYPWHGDVPRGVKARARKCRRGVLLITPESLEALFVLRGLEVPTLFMGARAIVIDELHALLDNERGVHLRSLLSRLELSVNHRIRRVGLSATLGEMSLVREYLRPGASEAVAMVEGKSDGQELRAQIRGYSQGQHQDGDDGEKGSEEAAKQSVALHLFSRLRGTRNLIFAGSRQGVEWYADALREMSERARLPVEFLPHHASLSREHRIHLEQRLKTHPATTAVCTSTLELGIDIGEMASVAQIGAPFSVSSLRQRLGRSGRRRGEPAVLRLYAIGTAVTADSHPLDRLQLELVRSVAMLELLIDGWCEPPTPEALHLSTLTHQILSVITEHGGASAQRLYMTLCKRGPFGRVEPQLFARLLRRLGAPETALIEQAPDGTLLLGSRGEQLVEHYSFYAVFQTPEEYRIIADGKLLGTLPVVMILTVGMSIVFSARRWRVTGIDDHDKVIEVTADRKGRAPQFGGGGSPIHDRVTETMRHVLSRDDLPLYLDEGAAGLLREARAEFRRLDLGRRSLCEVGERTYVLATWVGTVKTSSLALALRTMGYAVTIHDGFLEVRCDRTTESLPVALERIAGSGTVSFASLLAGTENLRTEKFHRYLSPELLVEDAISSRIDLDALPALACRLLAEVSKADTG